MTFVKKVTKNQLFLPLFSMVLVMLVNIIYDVANGNPAFNFFSISINNGILYGRLIDILNRGSEAAILALGMTLVVSSSAGTDISVGSVMSLAGGVCCVLLAGFGNVNVNEYAIPLWLGVVAGILVACLCGAFNGFLVAGLKIQPMVATLILYSAGRAIGLLLCNSNIVYINVESFKFFGGYCWIFPTPILITVLCIVVTGAGPQVHGPGHLCAGRGHQQGSRPHLRLQVGGDHLHLLCGVRPVRGHRGITATSRIYSADTNNIGLNLEMDAILAVALGGNSLGGGKFRLSGSIIGAYTIQAITTTLYALGVSSAQPRCSRPSS